MIRSIIIATPRTVLLSSRFECFIVQSGASVKSVPLESEIQPMMVMKIRQSGSQTLCVITIAIPKSVVIAPANRRSPLLLLNSFIIPETFLTLIARPSPMMVNQIASSLAKKIDSSIDMIMFNASSIANLVKLWCVCDIIV